MQKIINRKKYDTDTADLVAVHVNRTVLSYLKELEQWHLENDVIEEEPEDNETDQEEIPELKEEEEDDFVFLSFDSFEELLDFVFDDTEEEQDDDESRGEDSEPEVIVVEDFTFPEPVEGIELGLDWKITRLYRKRSTGELFLYKEGGYFCPTITAFLDYSGESRGEPPFYNEDLAFDWAVTYLSVPEVERIFGEVEE